MSKAIGDRRKNNGGSPRPIGFEPLFSLFNFRRQLAPDFDLVTAQQGDEFFGHDLLFRAAATMASMSGPDGNFAVASLSLVSRRTMR
jgi:hypothetical protein